MNESIYDKVEEIEEPPKPGMAYLISCEFLKTTGNRHYLRHQIRMQQWEILKKMPPGVFGETMEWKKRMKDG